MRKQESQDSTSIERLDDTVEELTSSSDSSSEIEDKAAERTLRELNTPPVDQQPLCIVPQTLATPFKLKFVKSLASSMQSLEQQMSQLATSVSKLESQGKLPSQTKTNPKHNANAITLRSGKELEDVPAKLRRGHALETEACTEPEAEFELTKRDALETILNMNIDKNNLSTLKQEFNVDIKLEELVQELENLASISENSEILNLTNSHTKMLPSIMQAPELELKPLPEHLNSQVSSKSKLSLGSLRMVRTKNPNYRHLPSSSSSPSSSNPPSSPPPRPKRKCLAPTKPSSLPKQRTRSMTEHSPIVESSHEPILESVPKLVTEPEHETISEQPRKATRHKQGTRANQLERANKATQAAIQIAKWEARYEQIQRAPIVPCKYINPLTPDALNITDDVHTFMENIGWTKFMNIQCPIAPEVVQEFYSTLTMNLKRTTRIDSPAIVQFQMLERKFSLSLLQFNKILGFCDEEDDESSIGDFLCDYPDDFDQNKAYRELTGCSATIYNPCLTNDNALANNALKYIYRFLAYSFSGRKDSPELKLNYSSFGAWSLTHGGPSGDAPHPSSSSQTTMEGIRASLARMEAQLA
ncbi:putative RNA-dependent RNA polymerase 1 [Senna tora]|uniref:Putative RNA-dependent RNA polymerase 1 n=1 Tax=Senna tora TaxID=362788 RepID=A0A834X8L9_9FABA|nr:putative RNA-dependent RNA polymerase 1 [Senna tora]